MNNAQKLIDELIKKGFSMEEAIKKIMNNPKDIQGILGGTGNIIKDLVSIIGLIGSLFEDKRAKELLLKYEALEVLRVKKAEEIKKVLKEGGEVKL